MKSKMMMLGCLLLSHSTLAQVSISTVSQSQAELKIQSMLKAIHKKYDLAPWLNTQKVVVDQGAKRPHSHPVLTLNTNPKYLNDQDMLLSAYLHENLHWHLVNNRKGTFYQFTDAIKLQFPEVKSSAPYGSRTERGTLSHLIVCYFEFKAMTQLLGEEKAKRLLQSKDYYTWVYQTILDSKNHFKLETLVKQFGLELSFK